MMTDSDIFQETYLPINNELQDKKRNSDSPQDFTIKVEQRTWKPLFEIETESICLSLIVPYHIIAKIASSIGYGYNLFYFCYLSFTVLFYYTFYLYTLLFIPNCNSNKESKQKCFYYSKNNCETKYVLGSDNVYYPCNYNNDFDICYQTDHRCIEENTRSLIIITIVILNVISFGSSGYLHYHLRKDFKRTQLVTFNKMEDVFISFFLSSLSLAQQYKDLYVDPKEFEGITGIRL